MLKVYSPLETLLQGIAPGVARWSGLEIRQFTVYQPIVSNPQGTGKYEILSKTDVGLTTSKYIEKYKDGAIGDLIDGRIDR